MKRSMTAIHATQHKAAPKTLRVTSLPQKSVKKRIMSHNRPAFRYKVKILLSGMAKVARFFQCRNT